MIMEFCLLNRRYSPIPLLCNPKIRPETTFVLPVGNRRRTRGRDFFPLSLNSPKIVNPMAVDSDDRYEYTEVSTNSDLAPISSSDRTFTAWDMGSLWVGLVVGVPTYYLAGSLVDLGMAWWQGVATVFMANVILLVPLIMAGVPGTKYGISFPILARSAFGVTGAHVPCLLRSIVACGWYGIETWIGGEAIFLLLPTKLKSSVMATELIPWLGTTPLEFTCFMVFWTAQMAIVWGGIDRIRHLEKYSAPILIILTASLLIWAYTTAGGFGPMLSLPPRLNPSQFRSAFFPSLTANISFWATVALNIPDFTRHVKTQREQILGQIWLPFFMSAFTFVGLAVTSSTEVIFGNVISDPIRLLGKIGGLPTTIAAILGISLATITTNIAANIVAPANSLVNLSPSSFTFRKGALLTALIGILFQPWRLLKSGESFTKTWLVGYSVLIGPIGGIVIADYYLVNGMELQIEDIYDDKKKNGRYYYWNGVNFTAILALVVGIVPVVPGFLSTVGLAENIGKGFVSIYENAWFFGFFVSGLVYWSLTWLLTKTTNRQKPSHHP